MKKVLIFMLLISMLLTGCSKTVPVESGEAEHSTVSTETKDAEQSFLPSEAITSSLQPVQEETQPEESIEETDSVQITQPHTEKVERTADNESETESMTMDKQTEADTPPATEAPQSTELQETQQIEEAAETELQPTEGEPESSFRPVTESEPETTETTDVTEEPEESMEPTEPFDIGVWVSFAQGYAQSVGLNLDSAAVDCWDNPITAGTHCIYLERDICSRLDRYNRDDDITDVWIWAVEIGKAIIAGVKALVVAIAAGGWVAVVVVMVICLIALIVGSCFGIFFSSEDTGSDQTMQQVVQEINEEYLSEIDYIKSSVPYDELEMSGARAVWPEVLSIYAVKTTTDPDNPQEVASITDEKIELLRDIFWVMNEIDYRTEEVIGTEIIESDDGNGNIVEETVEVTEVYLYITVSHKTADEMAIEYNFNDDQLEQLAALFNDENNSLWTAVLYGISTTDDQIVAVALSQIGNVGGQPYWSWYGFGSRVPWCACFVSWCANECGYIDTGVIPKFAGCVNGVNWFREEWSPYEYWETMLPEGLEAVHPRYAISKRNEWMVNESDMVICYIKHSWGGAAKYVEIASKLQKSVINISCQCRQ